MFHRDNPVFISAGAREQHTINDTWTIKSNLQDRGATVYEHYPNTPYPWKTWFVLRLRKKKKKHGSGEKSIAIQHSLTVLTDQRAAHLPRKTDERGRRSQRAPAKWSTSETDWPCVKRACFNNTHTRAHSHTDTHSLQKYSCLEVMWLKLMTYYPLSPKVCSADGNWWK